MIKNMICFFLIFLVVLFSFLVSDYVLSYGYNEFNRIKENCKTYFNVDYCEIYRNGSEYIALPDLKK